MARITGCGRIVLAVVCACLMLAGCSRPILKPPVPRPLSEGGRVALDSRAKGHVGGNGFWTRDRLAQAVRGGHPDQANPPSSNQPGQQKQPGQKQPSAQATQLPASALNDPKLSNVQLGEGTVGVGENFIGLPQTGTFFYRTGPRSTAEYHTCSGSVVNSASGTIVVSAAHCWYNVNAQSVVFIPQFSWVNGRAQTPYGVWEMSGSTIYIDPRYESEGDDGVAYDVAVLSVAPNVANQTIQEVTGGFDISLDAQIAQPKVEIVGYPADDSDNSTYTAAYPRHCLNSTSEYQEAGTSFFNIKCSGMASGVSGGPWLVPKTVNGVTKWCMVAVTGGGQDGGGYTDDESVGVRMSGFVAELIAKAEAFDLSKAGDWSGAQLMAAGNFGAVDGVDDLVVSWRNGTVDVFLGTGSLTFPFMASRRASRGSSSNLPPRMLTTADLDGSGQDDLVALGQDGKVMLLQDPGSGGPRRLMHLNPHDPLEWVQARQIIGGDFSPDGDHKRDDLLVVWADGTTSVYLHVSKHGLTRDRPWPVHGLKGLVGGEGGANGPLASGIDGVVAAGDFGGGRLTDVMVVGKDRSGRPAAWLITDDDPKGALPVYRIAPYDIRAAGIDPSQVKALAAGDFDAEGTGSDVVIDMRGSRVLMLANVKAGKKPTPSDVTTVVSR